MTSSAPRYDSRLLAAVSRLDDPALPIAETVRRVASVADELGLTRPSYAHMRTYVLEHRIERAAAAARRRAIAKVLFDAYWDATTGKHVADPYELEARLREAARTPAP